MFKEMVAFEQWNIMQPLRKLSGMRISGVEHKTRLDQQHDYNHREGRQLYIEILQENFLQITSH